jgi:hypothetical protein
MIHAIHLDTAPIPPGTKRTLSIEADGALEVTLWCYQDPPGRVVACGRIVLNPGQTTAVGPDIVHFPPGIGGELRIRIVDTSDLTGREVVLEVDAKKGSPSAAPAMEA